MVVVASEASKRAARESGLEVRWHAVDGELVPFVPLANRIEAVSALEEARALIDTAERDRYVSPGWREDARRWLSGWADVLGGH